VKYKNIMRTRLTERDLSRIVKRVVNEDISDRTGDLYSSLNDVIDTFEGIEDSEIIMVLESILAHHKGKVGRRKRNIGHITADEVRKNFNR
jgi:hypothetical protein